MSDSDGFFVSLEGIDGSGKSTQAPLIAQQLQDKGYKAIATSEPSDRQIGQLCRVYLSDPHSIPEVDALLFAADRIEHYQYEVVPKLQEGYIVITDRYVHSSIVYQGSQGAPMEWIREINKFATLPNLVVYLDISVLEALSRLASSNREVREKFEFEDYLKRLKGNYEELEIQNKVAVSGEKSQEALSLEITEIIVDKLPSDFNVF